MSTTEMPRFRRLPIVAGAIAISMLTWTAAASPHAYSAVAPSRSVALDTPLGCGSAAVTKTLSTGSAWRMCVRIHDYKGLVAENVQFRPASGEREYVGWMPVIDSLALAQLNVPYDVGNVTFDDVTQGGMGGSQLVAQNDATCAGSVLDLDRSYLLGDTFVEQSFPGICVGTVSTGLSWHSQDYPGIESDRYGQQGQALEITSLSKVGWYEYQQRFRFTDQGAIAVGLGATGDVGQDAVYFPTDPAVGWPIGTTAEQSASHPGSASHWHNAIYRVDFGIDDGPQEVQRWDYVQPSSASNRVEGTATKEDRAFTASPSTSRETWWRVLNRSSLNPDGHPRSYEIVNDSIQDAHQPLTTAKISFTNANPCQEFAWTNLNPQCQNQSIVDYVNGDSEPLTDPVAWVNVGFHHIVRDEDQSPMPVHWQEFSLEPRDMLAQQATVPVERSCINGGPLQPGGSCAAINTIAPVITASPGVIKPGSVLTGSSGTWKTPRSFLTYQRLWLRDGQPITITGADGLPATVTSHAYTVTPADVGHKISVRVLASATGIIPGSALSNVITVPKPVTPRPTQTATPRSAPTVKASIRIRGKRAIVRIQVAGNRGAATGKVTVQGRGWKRVKTLTRGSLVVNVPRSTVRKTATLTVRYAGSSAYVAKVSRFKVKRITK